MQAHGPRLGRAAMAIATLTLGSAACLPAPSTSATPSVPPSGTPAVLASPSTEPTPRASPSAEPAEFDPTAVSVTLSKVATVPGRPLAIANAGDGSGRLFVAGQDGYVYIVDGADVNGAPFLDIHGQVSRGGEQGLLGLAFHPDFPDDPRVFVNYTNGAGDTIVASFDVDPQAPDAVVPGSESLVIEVDQPYANHNGGGIAFGPDGYLYVALGDGGAGGDPHGNGQNLEALLGKILRLDVNVTGQPYGIPSDNPFVGKDGRDEIWQFGLRNPFRISFDQANGDLWIGDVGQGEWEEIDVARAGVGGLNFGWNVMEGTSCYEPRSGCPTDGLNPPVAQYDHEHGFAVIGGYAYRGPQAVLAGGYIFSDNYTGRIWAIAAAGEGMKPLVQVGQAAVGVAGYGESEAGELYAADLDGSVFRVVGKAR